jgi:hypothetical protein
MVKGESDDRDHLLPSVPVTSSGVKVKESLKVKDFESTQRSH